MEDLKKSHNYGKASVDEIELQLSAVENPGIARPRTAPCR